MKMTTIALVLGLSFAGMPILGCDKELSHSETTQTNPDGTVTQKQDTVKEQPDGTVVHTQDASRSNNP